MVHIRSLFFEGPLAKVESQASKATREIGVGEVIWNVTNKCNLLCKHCYVAASSKIPAGELSDEETVELIHKIGKTGIPLLFVTGGEPFMRQNLFEILEIAHDYNIRTVLSTNATLINRESAKQLKSLGVDYVALSIYGPEKFHDEYVKVPGTFSKIVKNIQTMRDEGIGLCIKTTINSEIFPNLPFILDFAKNVGARLIYPCDLITSGRAKNLAQQRVSNSDWHKFGDSLLKEVLASKEGLEFDIGAQPSLAFYIAERLYELGYDVEKAIQRLSELNACHVGRGIMAINTKGDVIPCNFIQDYTVGNVRDISLGEAINRLKKLGEQKVKGYCGDCKYTDLCRGCRAKALLTHKDILGEDPSCLLHNPTEIKSCL